MNISFINPSNFALNFLSMVHGIHESITLEIVKYKVNFCSVRDRMDLLHSSGYFNLLLA